MSSSAWHRFQRALPGGRGRSKGGRHRTRRPLLEALEGRALLAINVAVVGTGSPSEDSGFAALRDQLNDDTYFDFNATLVSASAVDTPIELSDYDAVVIGNYGSTYLNPFDNTAFTSALRNWVQSGGGGVVMTGWGIYGAINSAGRSDLDTIIPVNMASGYSSSGGGVLQIVGAHPVTAGVSSFQTTGSYYIEYPYAGPDSGATVLATTNTSPSAVAGQAGSGRAVYLGPIYSGSLSYYNTTELRTGSPDRLLEQAVAWTATRVRIVPVSPDPRTTAVDSVDVVFQDAINPATFDYHDLTLTRNGGLNIVDSGITVSFVSGRTYRISGLSSLTSADGIYTLTVNATGILSPLGVAGIGGRSETWVHDSAPGAPTVVGTSPVNGGTLTGNSFHTMTVTFSEPVTPATAQDPDNYRLVGPAGAIPVTTATLDGTGKTVILTFATQSSGGSYSLRIGNVTDLVGNAMIGLAGYSAPDIYQTPGAALSSTVGDFDGDGRADLVAALNSSSYVVFIKGLTGGAFAIGNAMYVGSNGFVKEMTSADLNNDGKLDLILAEQSYVGVYLGNGNGTFQGRQVLPMSNSNAIQVADLNGDDRPDIIAGDTYGYVRSFLNNGLSSVGSWPFLTSSGPGIFDFHLAEVNGDGRLDLVSNYNSNYGNAWIGSGAPGQFSYVSQLNFNQGTASEHTVLADVDGDGRPDVVTGAYGVNITYGTSSPPYFGPTQNLGSDFTGAWATNVQAADLDGDGDLDLVKGGWGNGTVFISSNRGDGTFSNQAINLSGNGIQYIWQLQTPDINGDGLPDLIGTSHNTNRIFVLKSQGGVLATRFQFTANTPPTADAGGPYAVEYGSSVTLDGTGSIDPEGDALTYTWDFGDGTTYIESSTSAPDGAYDGRVQHTYSGLGTYTASLTVADSQGLTGTDQVIVTIRDTAPPATQAALSGASVANGWYTGPVTVTLSATDAASGVVNIYYRIGDSGSYAFYDPTQKPVVSTDGAVAVSFYSVDAAGNSEAVQTVSFKIDRTAPVVSMTGPAADSLTNNTTPTLAASASDGPSGVAFVQFQISGDNGDTWTDVGTASTTTPYVAQVASALADGIYLARAVATDAAGNQTTSAAVRFTVDATAPFLTGVSDIPDPFSPNGDGVYDSTTLSYTVSEASRVTVTVSDATHGLVRTLVSGEWQVAGSYATVWNGRDDGGNVVSDGTYTYNIRATDAAGNVTNSATLDSTDHTVTVDNTVPTVAITAQPTDPTRNNSASFTFSGTDNQTGTANLVYQYTLNGSAFWTLSGNSLSLSGLADGRYTLAVRSVDEAGNVSATASYRWTVDTTAPTTTADVSGTQGTNGWYVAPATISLSADDANGDATVSGVDTTFYTIDAGAAQTYTGPFTLSDDGKHTVTYWSVDKAGNEETPHQSLLVNIDQTAPTIVGTPTITANADGWYNREVTVHFTSSDDGSGLASDSADQVLGEGLSQSVQGTATDHAGNTRTATVSGINIDLTAPITTATRSVGPNTNGWNNTDVTVTLGAIDGLSGVKATYYRLDGGDALAGTSLILSEGVHTVEFWSVDRADNEELHQTLTVRIDETVPDISAGRALGSEANGYGWNRARVTISYTASDGLSGLPSAIEAGSYSFTEEGEGLTYRFTVTDLAGNSASATVSDINIDLTAPTISAGATTADGNNYTSGTWTNQDVTVHFTSDDPLAGIATSQTDVTVSTEGPGQGVDGVAFDKAGNSTPASFIDIRIDKTAPVTTADPHGYAGEWVNHAVTISLSAADQFGLSGVAATYYSIDGGTAQAYDESAGIVVSDPGVHTVRYWSTDIAGNVEGASTGHTLTVKIDETAPVTTASRSGEEHASGHSGWNNADVTITLNPSDDGGSGLAHTVYSTDGGANWTAYSAPFTLSQDGIYTVLYRSVDIAGNIEDTSTGHTLTVKIDRTAPLIDVRLSASDPATGWYNIASGPAVVHYTTSDLGGSGLAQANPESVTFLDGSAQSLGAVTIFDVAGNRATSTIFTGINQDTVAPVLSAEINAVTGSNGWYNASGKATVAYSATDATSGVTAPAPYVFNDGIALSVAAITVFDAAGNVSDSAGAFSDIYQDTLAPTLMQSINNPAVTGWYNGSTGPAVVTYSSHDTTSGVTNPAAVTVADGTNQTVPGITVTDAAGNTSLPTAGYSGLKVDTVAPTLSAGMDKSPALTGWYNGTTGVPTYRYEAGDNGSGLDAQSPAAGSFTFGQGSGLSHSFTVTDVAGNSGQVTSPTVNVDTIAPTLSNLTSPLDPIAQAAGGNKVTASASFSDPSGSGFASGTFTWGSSSNAPTTVTTLGAGGVLSGSTIYTTVGIYRLELAATDLAGNSVTTSFPNYVVIYNPSNGFVTGGGWINSPAGAFVPDPRLTGKANFGFVSKYQKGASTPTGDTQFTFGVADLKFLSTSYEWLVIAGAKAQYKGEGTVNGQAGYGFMLTAIDGQITNGGGADTFRIKIWDKVSGAAVYDNQLGASDDVNPSTALGGGSIVIHKNLVLSDNQATGRPRTEVLTQDGLAPAVAEAIARWQAAGLDEAGLDRLRQVRFVIADLDGSTLGHAGSDVISVDQDAAGYGWFTDASPAGDLAFGHRVAADEFRADAASPAAGRVDLLTLLMHEMGHVVGLDDLDPREHPHDLMTEDLSTGIRRLPRRDAIGGVAEVGGPVSAFTSISIPETTDASNLSILLVTSEPEGHPSRFVPSPNRPSVISIPRRNPGPVLGPKLMPRAALSLVDLDFADHRGPSSLDTIPDDLISDLTLLGRKQLLGPGRRRGR